MLFYKILSQNRLIKNPHQPTPYPSLHPASSLIIIQMLFHIINLRVPILIPTETQPVDPELILIPLQVLLQLFKLVEPPHPAAVLKRASIFPSHQPRVSFKWLACKLDPLIFDPMFLSIAKIILIPA